MVDIEDFKKLGLKIGRVIQAERINGSDKLLKLEIDLGNEKRQIVAGLGQSYQPEELINSEIIVVSNLEPKTIMSLESNGMLLATQDEESRVILIRPEKEVAPGSEVK